ncbi:PT repeat family protein [Phlyctema vagabunda]|uniref:PT repeat family protein n=1 Tax=Phlyctema vagabunda TaxID=108571 RepID=A0ABR4P788_9HELO
MAPSKTTVRVKYANLGTQPPVYVAGSFSEPAWDPQEMQYTTDENNEHDFYKDVEVKVGEKYQYKFRLGPGDWWLLNENSPTATDNLGNRNNLLLVPEPKDDVVATNPDDDAVKPQEGDGELIASINLKKASKDPKPNDANGLMTVESTEKPGATTPDIADVASDVADSAATLDKEKPAPIVTDEEAGRIGLRRLSNTPIPEVANTAAEVADSATIIDKPHMKIDMPSKPSEPETESEAQDTVDSGTVTPWEERAPLFEHECMGTQSGQYRQASYQPNALHQTTSHEEAIREDEIDFNDPTLEEFPHDRQSILDRVRTMETRMDEDETKFDDSPLSPAVSANRSPDRNLSSPSPGLLAVDQHQSPSLQSIAEENSEQPEENLVRLPSAADLHQSNGHTSSEEVGTTEDNSARVKRGDAPSAETRSEADDISAKRGRKSSAISPEEDSQGSTEAAPDSEILPELTKNGSPQEAKPINKGEPKITDTVGESSASDDQGPSIILQPATPSSSSINVTTESLKKSTDQAKSSAVDTDDRSSHLVSRKQQPSAHERSLTPSSARSDHDKKSRNILIAFWRVVFVDWVGGIITRLCGGRRHT